MNWGRRLKRMFTENWREKIISLLLAFLFWFMIKAQDARNNHGYMVQPPPIMPRESPAPTSLEPTLPAAAPIAPDLAPVVPPPASAVPLPGAAAEPGATLVPPLEPVVPPAGGAAGTGL